MTADDASPEASGDWKVDHDECVACGAPPAMAPDLMGFGTNHADPRDVQCYFKRQPTTPAEIERACRAAAVSCCAAVRYEGPDEALRERVDAMRRSRMQDVASWVARHRARQRKRLWFALFISSAAILVYLWLFGRVTR